MLKVFILVILAQHALAGIRIDADKLRAFRERVLELQSELDNQRLSAKTARIIESIPTGARKGSTGSLEFYACNACHAMIDEFMYVRRVELFNDTDLIDMAIDVCSVFEFESEAICGGIVNLYAPTVIYIIDNRPELTADTVCKFLLNDGDCANPNNDETLEFRVSIDERTEPAAESMASNDTDELIIVHITDIHVDLKYSEGSLAACDNFACCRRDSTVKSTNISASQLAGYWGSYNHCDTPLSAIEDAFRHIVERHPKIDAIYFTGDIVDHHLYDTTVEGMRSSLTKVYGMMNDIFGSIPVYPIIGNHENQNLFAPLYIDAPSFSTQWLYDHVAELWKTPESLQTVKDGGYYTKLIKPGLRVIALNNNLCFVCNFWVLFDVEPIREQFQWLHDTLLEAEERNERVHILAHIPSGTDTYHEACSREYQRIVERFHRTIAVQFNGHTEYFDFHLAYRATTKSDPIAVAFNGGALASYSRQNRNYMLYHMNAGRFDVKDAELWTYNLTAANQHGASQRPQWFRQFSFRDEFKLADLTASTLNELVHEMAKNSSIFERYWRMKVKNSDLFIETGCDSECRHDALCEVITSDNTNAILCENIANELKHLP